MRNTLDYEIDEFDYPPMAPDLLSIKVILSCHVTPVTPRTWDYPGDGGEREDETIEVKSAIRWDDDGNDWPLTKAELKDLQAFLDTKLDNDPDWREELFDRDRLNEPPVKERYDPSDW